MKVKLTILFCWLAVLVSSCGQTQELSNSAIRKQVLKVAQQYAQSISCGTIIDPNNLIALTPFIAESEYSIPEYVLIWIGDIGCNGGSHSGGYRIATLNMRAANVVTVDPLLSSPVITLPISPKSIKKISRLTSNSLKVIATVQNEKDCCLEYEVEITLARDKEGNWKISREKRN